MMQYKKRYLLVEGITDVAFVKYICLKNNIINNFTDFKKQGHQYTFDNLVIIDLKGQDNLKKELTYLKDEIEKISHISIIQDADDNFKNSKISLEFILNESNIDRSKVDYFLTPNHLDVGNLETLLLSTINQNEIIQCFNNYKKCLTDNQEIHQKALDKGQVYAYTMYSQKGENLYKPQDSFICKNGNDTNLWNLKDNNFQPIINFILQIFRHKVT